MNTHLAVKTHVVKVAHTAPGHLQKKEIVGCYFQQGCKLKYVKGVSCVTQLSCVKPVISVSSSLTSKLLANLAESGCQSKSSSNPERELHPPLTDLVELDKVPEHTRCYVNLHRNLYLLEALHQLIDKNTGELVNNQKSLGFFKRLF